MKTSLICVSTVMTLAIYCLLGGVMITGAGAASEPGEEIVLQGKKPARFVHTTHTGNGISCGTCHHDLKHEPLTEEAIAAVANPATLHCLSCHNDQHPNEELRRAKDIFHARCKTCHQEGYQGKNGPVKCTGCHLKSDKKTAEGC